MGVSPVSGRLAEISHAVRDRGLFSKRNEVSPEQMKARQKK
jgi:hypothetical protein